MESRWLLFPVLTVIYNLSVNHGILYCLCRHKRSSLKQFRVSLMITFSGREFQSHTILWLKKEHRTSSLKCFLWIFWLWPLVPVCTGWWKKRPGSILSIPLMILDLDHITTSSPMHQWWQFEPGEAFLIGGGIGDWGLSLLRVVGSSQALWCRFDIVGSRWHYHTSGVVWPW